MHLISKYSWLSIWRDCHWQPHRWKGSSSFTWTSEEKLWRNWRTEQATGHITGWLCHKITGDVLHSILLPARRSPRKEKPFLTFFLQLENILSSTETSSIKRLWRSHALFVWGGNCLPLWATTSCSFFVSHRQSTFSLAIPDRSCFKREFAFPGLLPELFDWSGQIISSSCGETDFRTDCSQKSQISPEAGTSRSLTVKPSSVWRLLDFHWIKRTQSTRGLHFDTGRQGKPERFVSSGVCRVSRSWVSCVCASIL